MKLTRKQQEHRMRSALEMLNRAKIGGGTNASGNDPVNPMFAIGWAKSALESALGLPDRFGVDPKQPPKPA